MSRMLAGAMEHAAVAGIALLVGLFSAQVAGAAGAQGVPGDVFTIEHFANVNTPGVSEDATVRITNPGSTGLRAWGTHVEVPGGVENFITETPFQDATLSSAELAVLAERCEDIETNGSGFGLCTCGTTEGPDEGPAPPGTQCALIYVFSADQQLAECCGCPVTPNGLRTLSVTNDLTSNPLTGVKPRRGVIKLLSSSGAEGPAGIVICDPAAPQLPPGPTTTTVTSTTATTITSTTSTTIRSTTSTTIASTTSTTATSTTVGSTTTTSAASTTTATTTAPSTTTSTAGSTTTTPTTTSTTSTTRSATGAFVGSVCRVQGRFGQLVCELRAIADSSLCAGGTINPSLQRRVLRKLYALESRLLQANSKGPKASKRALARMDRVLSTLQQLFATAAKRSRISPSCQVELAQQIGSLRAEAAALRQ